MSSSNELIHSMHTMTLEPPHCVICKNEMQFNAGDIIFGDVWYHSACWEKAKSNMCELNDV